VWRASDVVDVVECAFDVLQGLREQQLEIVASRELFGDPALGGKPWATSSREELRQLKQGAHRWDCIQYRYGYLTRTLLADPNASRCANALWLQRREIEELGLAKPGDWGTSVGVTLL